MVPEGGREEPVARGEEGKPPRGQSISVSGKWRELEGVTLESKGGDRVKRKGETEVCKGSIEAADEQSKWRDEKRGTEMAKNGLPGGGPRRALKDREASRPKGRALVLNLSPGVSAAYQEVSLLSASFRSHFIFFFILAPLSSLSSKRWVLSL